jgi:Raf kinase inhibitor-like YbhB/YbcL family protein
LGAIVSGKCKMEVTEKELGLELTSNDFDEDTTMPTSAASPAVGGEDRSPQLSWSGVPEGTGSFALTCWDPDAPTTVGFTHWVRFDIPTAESGFAAGANMTRGPWIDGITDIGEMRYTGMAPPAGDEAHRYIFTIYALDAESLGLNERTTYALLRFVLRGHVLDSATLTGRFAVPKT